jgi:pimeloyl-ACP methyl ester carboxylesterase
MPIITINEVKYHYTDTQKGDETIIFSHGLLWSGYMFHKQEAFLKDRFRVICYDHRGQGKTEAVENGYDMETLYKDAVSLIETLCPNQKVHFAGLSMGGFIAMRLAARRPDLLKSVILMETSADAEPKENVGKYKTLNSIVKWIGTWAVVGQVMPIMFGQKFLNDKSRKAERHEWESQMKLCKSPGIVKAVAGVIERKPIFDELSAISLPTLIMVGTQDVATIPAKAERIKSQITDSQLVYIEGGGHTSSIEEPEQVNLTIDNFLKTIN